jgi:hypothetical protein
VPDDPKPSTRSDLFATPVSTQGGIASERTSNGNQFEVIRDAQGNLTSPRSRPTSTAVVGRAIRITVAWSTALTPVGSPAVRVWFDKRDHDLRRTGKALTLPSSVTGSLDVGARWTPTPANGAIDDFKITAPLAERPSRRSGSTRARVGILRQRRRSPGPAEVVGISRVAHKPSRSRCCVACGGSTIRHR